MPPDSDSAFTLEPIEHDPFVAAAPPSGDITNPASQPRSEWADSPLAKVGRLIGERGLAGAMPVRTIDPAETMPDFWKRWEGMVSGLNRSGQGTTTTESTDNFAAAKATLDMTPQEQALYQRHVDNLTGPGGVDHPNGDRSTIYQAVVNHDGMFYNIPTVWDGAIISTDQAVKRVAEEGWDKFPKYATPMAAEFRYAQMHDYMEKDTAAYMQQKDGVPKANVALVPVDHDPFSKPQPALVAVDHDPFAGVQ